MKRLLQFWAKVWNILFPPSHQLAGNGGYHAPPFNGLSPYHFKRRKAKNRAQRKARKINYANK